MRRWQLWSGMFLVSALLSLGLAELGLRLAGRSPEPQRRGAEPVMHQPDPELGWRGKAGSYVVPPYSPEGRPIRFSVEADGARATGPTPPGQGPTLLVVGGSFSQGWAVDDSETFAWRLRERFPSLHVRNFGTAGYGTYQSLRVLERELPRLARNAVVLYGFIGHHELRNVAPGRWMKNLTRWSSQGMVGVPYASLGPDGRLRRHPPSRYPTLPLRHHLATAAALEELVAGQDEREAQARPVTEGLLLEMRELCQRHAASLRVVLLGGRDDAKRHYGEFLAAHEVAWRDCDDFPVSVVAGDGHPDGRSHARWADCMAPMVESGLAELGAGLPSDTRVTPR